MSQFVKFEITKWEKVIPKGYQGERIVAGTFFICGDNGEDFCSLPDDLCEKYVQKFAVPESISQDEVEQDMGFTLIGL